MSVLSFVLRPLSLVLCCWPRGSEPGLFISRRALVLQIRSPSALQRKTAYFYSSLIAQLPMIQLDAEDRFCR